METISTHDPLILGKLINKHMEITKIPVYLICSWNVLFHNFDSFFIATSINWKILTFVFK